MSGRGTVPGSVLAFHADSNYLTERTPTLGEVLPPEPRLTGGQALPLPRAPLMMPLGEALRLRRSCRDFQPAPLPLEEVSTLLAEAAGARSDPLLAGQFRNYPSAGALYPLRLYLVALRVEGLPEGVYRYQAVDHSLHRAGPPADAVKTLVRQMLGTESLDTGIGAAGAFLMLTANLPTITSKYGSRGYRFALHEAGHVGQNLMLAATAQGLGSLALGSVLDDRATEVVGTSLELEPVVYAVAIGQAVPVLRQALVPAPEVEDEAAGRERQVLAHLLGHGPADASVAELAERYRSAGRTALRSPPHPWLQWRLEVKTPRILFDGPVGGALQAMEEAGEIQGSWFLFKTQGGAHVRLRVLPAATASAEQVRARIERAIAEGQQAQAPSRAYRTLYEPETYLFGGPRGMELIHTLFMLDTRLALEAGRQERRAADRLSQVWVELVLRRAGLDNYERWDVWRKVCLLRPWFQPKMEPLVEKMRPVITQLFQTETAELARYLREALPVGEQLYARLEAWGNALQQASLQGELERPSREMLATGIVFHWNRMMYQTVEQSFLSRLWAEATKPSA